MKVLPISERALDMVLLGLKGEMSGDFNNYFIFRTNRIVCNMGVFYRTNIEE